MAHTGRGPLASEADQRTQTQTNADTCTKLLPPPRSLFYLPIFHRGELFFLVRFATSLDSMDDGPVFPTSPDQSRMFAFSTHSHTHTHSACCAPLCCVIVCVHRQSIKFSIVLRVYQGWIFFHSFTRHFGQSGRVAFYRYQYIIRRLFAREGAPARPLCVCVWVYSSNSK